jgi:hypothetical protein
MDKTVPEHRLDSTELLQIPYRDNSTFQNSLRTLPGIVQSPGGGIHVNGGAESQTYYALDGFNIADPLTGAFQSRIRQRVVRRRDGQHQNGRRPSPLLGNELCAWNRVP